jgi:predicted  nucleic acid-binding Zn-ribbon protein
MQEKLDKATAEYDKVAADLDKCNKEFQALQDDFNLMQQKQKDLQDTIENSKIKLIRAEKLTDLLSDEGKRWK